MRRRRPALLIGQTFCALCLCVSIASCGGGGKSSKPRDTDNDGVLDGSDCALSDESRWQLLPYASVDADSDTHRADENGRVCAGASLPAGYFATQAPEDEIDCDDANATSWQLLPYVSTDLDEDGFRATAPGQVCSGNALPTAYSESAASVEEADCDDSEKTVWRIMMTYEDRDGDEIGSGPGVLACTGLEPSEGHSLAGYDPVDDPNVPDASSVSDFDLQPALLVTPN